VALDLAVRNGTLVTSSGRLEADIGVRDGVITLLAPRGALTQPAADDIDATGLHVLPGLIDGHVHFREPGLEHEETWLTGTLAAVMGGVTTVLDMPNTLPPTDTAERARAKLELASRSAYCDHGLFGLVGQQVADVAGMCSSGLVVGLKVFLGPTTGGLSAPHDEVLRRCLELAHDHGLRVAFHAEDRVLIAAAEAELRRAGRADVRAHLESRRPEAEVAAIDHAAATLAAAGASGHILHVSSASGLEAVERWRAAGLDLTCEATPHHALLDEDAYENGTIAKVNPPFRGGQHAAALRAALGDGRIECVASDHAPHVIADKQRALVWDAAAGFAGVETLLPLLLTEVSGGRLALERLVEATSEGPARAWRLWPRKGLVAVGSDADLTLVDLGREGRIRAAELHGMNNHSPFEGRATVGAPVMTIVRGRIVVRDRGLVGEPGWGRQVSHS
jgi:dihydroorotase